MQIAYINTNGINQISAALGQYHKLGQDHFTAAMLRAWAADAEESFGNGNGMCFEIKSWDSNSGHTELVTISSDGYDVKTIYSVSANGVEFGNYEASNEQEARDLCAVDAGYKSEADMVETLERPSELVAVALNDE